MEPQTDLPPRDGRTRAELIAENRRLKDALAHTEWERNDRWLLQEELWSSADQLRKVQSENERLRHAWRDIFDLTPVASLILSPSGDVININMAGAERFELEREQLTGKPFLPWVVEQDHRQFLDHLRRCREETETVRTKLHLRSQSGRIVPVILASRRGAAVPGGEVIFHTVALDVMEPQNERQDYHDREVLLNLTLASSDVGAWRWWVQEDRLDWSPGVFALFGRERTGRRMRMADWLEIINPEDREQVETAVREPQSVRVQFEFRVALPDGRICWFRSCGQALESNNGKGRSIVGVISDVTHHGNSHEELARLRRELHEKITESNRQAAQMRTLAVQLTEAQHRERQRLAKMLHDHLQQWLVAAKFQIELFGQELSEQRLQGRLDNVQQLLDEALQASRTLTVELFPAVLNDRGLSAALEWLVRWIRHQYTLKVELASELDESEEPALDGVLRNVVFEAVRELLLNVVKHAQTKHAVIRLSRAEPDTITVLVEDNGCGFPGGDRPSVSGSVGGQGLWSIRHRLELLGGQFDLDSEPGRGTRVLLRVPLKAGDTVPLSPACGNETVSPMAPNAQDRGS